MNWIEERIRIPLIYENGEEGWKIVVAEVSDHIAVNPENSVRKIWNVTLKYPGFVIVTGFHDKETAKTFCEDLKEMIDKLKPFSKKIAKGQKAKDIKKEYLDSPTIGTLRNLVTTLRIAANPYMIKKVRRILPNQPSKISQISPSPIKRVLPEKPHKPSKIERVR